MTRSSVRRCRPAAPDRLIGRVSAMVRCGGRLRGLIAALHQPPAPCINRRWVLPSAALAEGAHRVIGRDLREHAAASGTHEVARCPCSIELPVLPQRHDAGHPTDDGDQAAEPGEERQRHAGLAQQSGRHEKQRKAHRERWHHRSVAGQACPCPPHRGGILVLRAALGASPRAARRVQRVETRPAHVAEVPSRSAESRPVHHRHPCGQADHADHRRDPHPPRHREHRAQQHRPETEEEAEAHPAGHRLPLRRQRRRGIPAGVHPQQMRTRRPHIHRRPAPRAPHDPLARQRRHAPRAHPPIAASNGQRPPKLDGPHHGADPDEPSDPDPRAPAPGARGPRPRRHANQHAEEAKPHEHDQHPPVTHHHRQPPCDPRFDGDIIAHDARIRPFRPRAGARAADTAARAPAPCPHLTRASTWPGACPCPHRAS